MEIKPKIAFPVHDGLLNESGLNITHGVIKTKLEEANIDFRPIRNGEGLTYLD